MPPLICNGLGHYKSNQNFFYLLILNLAHKLQPWNTDSLWALCTVSSFFIKTFCVLQYSAKVRGDSFVFNQMDMFLIIWWLSCQEAKTIQVQILKTKHSTKRQLKLCVETKQQKHTDYDQDWANRRLCGSPSTKAYITTLIFKEAEGDWHVWCTGVDGNHSWELEHV